MAIVQISKIQQRSGNIVDLPQLDEAEFGFASDAKRLFIGKVSPNENIEVLTSYSNIAFSQIDGAIGNVDISAITVDDGQVLAYDGINWVNKGGNAGGLITLGDVSNVKIDGGAIGYVLETDGTGTLSWTPKATLLSYILNATQATTCVVTTTEENLFVNKQEVTITGVTGMTQLNGNSYYVKPTSNTTFELYTNSTLTTPVNSSAFTKFAYTTVANSNSTTDRLGLASSTSFVSNTPIKFVGNVENTNLTTTTQYYVYDVPTTNFIRVSISNDGNTSNIVQLGTNSSLSGLAVYATGARAIAAVGGGSGSTTAGGSDTSIQFNQSGIIQGGSSLTWDYGNSIFTVIGNATIGNVSITSAGAVGSVTANILVSNIATGTAPLTVTSTTRVANLNVAYANVADHLNTAVVSTGTYYPILANATSGNVADGANANLSFNAATGNLSTTILSTTGIITAGGNITGANILTAGSVTASTLTSNVATGTAPLTVTSTTRVANLNVAYANVADFINVSDVSSGTFYPILANAASGNISEGSNANLTFNAATGALNATLLGGTLTTAAQPNITSVGTLTALTVSGTITVNDIATFGTTGDDLNITGGATTTLNDSGGNINLTGGTGNGTGVGGGLYMYGGNASSTGNAAGGQIQLAGGFGYGQGAGGQVLVTAGDSGNATGGFGATLTMVGGAFDGKGGNVSLEAGAAGGTNSVGGSVYVLAGPSTGNATPGQIIFQTSTAGSGGSTLQTLANRVIIDDAQMNIRFTTASTSTATGALEVAGGVGVGGNVYASAFYGAATGLTSIPGGNVSGTVANATHASTANTVTNSTQSNITSVGTLLGLSVNSGSLATVSAPFNFEQTWNNSSVVFTAIKQNITDTASDAASRLFDLQVGGTSRFYVDKVGNVVTGNISTGTLLSTTSNSSANTNVGGNVNLVRSFYLGNTTETLSRTSYTSTNFSKIYVRPSFDFNNTTTITAADAAGLSNYLQGASSYTSTVNPPPYVLNHVDNLSTGIMVLPVEILPYSVGAASNGAVFITGGNTTGNGVTSYLRVGDYADTYGVVLKANTSSVSGNLVVGSNITVTGTANVGNLLTTVITSGANTTGGSITGNWTLTAGSQLNATYADLAEYYEADQDYEPGTVLEFGGEKEVTIAEDSTTRVAGVVSTNPAYAMNANCSGIAVAIALQGRVPVKVRGTIRKGDMMISGGDGYARPSNSPLMGSVIGKALENFNGTEGVIEIAIGRL